MQDRTSGLLRWGVLGAARIAHEQVVPAIRRAGAGEVLGVSSASGRAGSFADALDIERRYGTHEELLSDSDINVVYVALPNSLHAPWILRAVESGKHVLCEKPIVLDPRALDRIATAATTSGVVVAEGFMYRHHAQMRVIREVIAAGDIGDLCALHARLHFALERTPQPDIRLLPDLGGGALWDLGCYPVDFFGAILAGEPDQVVAVGSRDEENGVFTHVAASLRYGSVTAGFDCGFDAQMVGTATVIGSAGSISVTDLFRSDLVGGVGTVVVDSGSDRRSLTVGSDQYAEQAAALASQIRHGTADMAAWDHSARTARTLARIDTTLHAGTDALSADHRTEETAWRSTLTLPTAAPSGGSGPPASSPG